jgi:hypothetical protein
MRDQAAINEKIRQKLLLRYQEQGSSLKGKPGKKHTEETKQLIAERSRPYQKTWKTPEQIRARKLATVQKYYMKRRNQIPPDADLVLIKKIYEHCPSGYHVDHIVSVAEGGPHHQDNLQYLPASENIRKGKNRKYDESLVIRWQDTVPL